MIFTDLPGWGNWLRERHLLKRVGSLNEKVGLDLCGGKRRRTRNGQTRRSFWPLYPWEIVGITHERVSSARLGRSSERNGKMTTLGRLLSSSSSYCTSSAAAARMPVKYISGDVRQQSNYIVVHTLIASLCRLSLGSSKATSVPANTISS